MAEKTHKKPPLQERSRQTVKSILEAATRILSRDGLSGLNTNRVAEVAGVSVGSVYQFFKNKESILEELLTSALDRNLEELVETARKSSEAGFGVREFLDTVIDNLYESFEKRGFVTAALLEHAPQLLGMKRFRAIDDRLIPIFRETLRKTGLKIRPADEEMAIFVVMQSVRGVFTMAFSRKMSSEQKLRVKRELVEMCVRYLEPESA